MSVSKKTACDGVKIDKNIIQSYLNKVKTGDSNFELVEVFYSGTGVKCQSGNCNRRIHNVFVFIDNDSGERFNIGSHCAQKYGNDIDQLVGYWLTKLNHATQHTLKQAKRQAKIDEARNRYREQYDFCTKYLQLKPSNFFRSIVSAIDKGWSLSDKQVDTINRIMSETDFDQIVSNNNKDQIRYEARLWNTMRLFECLDQVSFGQRYSTATMFVSIRDSFDSKGFVTDKQLAALKRMMHTFRRQIPVKFHVDPAEL